MVNKVSIDLTTLSTRQLRTRRRKIAARITNLEVMLRGSVVEQHRRCGKEGCKCQDGEGHGPYTYLALGRPASGPRLTYVPAGSLSTVLRLVDATETIEIALEEIAAINAELLARRELD